MVILYALTMCDTQLEEEFFIGVFSTEEYALSTAKAYCAKVQGFKDYPCTYSIMPKTAVGTQTDKKMVYRISGWDVVDGKDVNIWESDLYTDKKTAEAAYAAAQKKIKRQEWSFDCFKVNECHFCSCHILVPMMRMMNKKAEGSLQPPAFLFSLHLLFTFCPCMMMQLSLL